MTATVTTDPAALLARVARLRRDQAALIQANGRLCARGITVQVAAVCDRLQAIQTEAHHLADQLRHLGLIEAAEHATEGWATIVRPPAPTPTVYR